jgi:capsular exopolysaccharide synthesis family protein
MTQLHPNMPQHDDSDIIRALLLFTRNVKIFLITIPIGLLLAFLYNRYATPVYRVFSSLMILEDRGTQGGNVDEYINSELFGSNQGFQNELYVLQSTPVIEQTVKNLGLTVNYFRKNKFGHLDAYNEAPFNVLILSNHNQPEKVSFFVSIHKDNKFTVRAEVKVANFVNLESGQSNYSKDNWSFEYSGEFGKLIETSDLAFILEYDSSINQPTWDEFLYGFSFVSVPTVTGKLKGSIEYSIVDRDATVIELDLNISNYWKGIDILNEIMEVYSTQNLNRKNHIAEITIEYIDQQLSEISDSLSQTENNMQQFRSSRQLLDVSNQVSEISAQYLDLQNQMAELVTRKRYYDYLAEYIVGEDDFSNMIVPASIGIQDELLNNHIAQLISLQSQRNNLIKNQQEKNPLVQRLEIQIESTKKTISDNISAVQKTLDISIDEMNKRINRVKSEISRLPKTQRQLSGIERNYRLNDAIYNYLLEKRAEAKISQASNLPDNIIIEPAGLSGKVSPNLIMSISFALSLSIILPYVFLFLKGIMREKIDYQDKISYYTDALIIGKIPHSNRINQNLLFEFPKSSIAEAFRALRTNIEYQYKNLPHKVILVTSSIEGEGKSFTAQNLAMVYAQLGRKTILLDFDLRKPTEYFSEKTISPTGLTSFLTSNIALEDLILHSPHGNLDYIPSGPIPPNPVELLAAEEIKEIIVSLKDRYDYIVIDTTPLAQVADAYLLLDHADLKLIIARYNYTQKKIFHLLMNDLRQKNVDNVGVILNDNRVYANQYGYGYGYEQKKKRWYKR